MFNNLDKWESQRTMRTDHLINGKPGVKNKYSGGATVCCITGQFWLD